MPWWERDPEEQRISTLRRQRLQRAGRTGRWWLDAPGVDYEAGARWTPPGLAVEAPEAPVAPPSFVQGGPAAVLPPEAAEVERQWWPAPEVETGPSWYESLAAKPWPATLPPRPEPSAQWQPPQSVANLVDWANALMEQGVGRLQAAWEKPEARVGPPPVVPTLAEASRELFQGVPFLSEEQKQAAATGLQAIPALGTAIPSLMVAAKAWEAATAGETPAARAGRLAEQVSGVGLAAFVEPPFLAQDVATAAALSGLPEAEGLEPREIAPLGEAGMSILFKPVSIEEQRAGVQPWSRERLQEVAGPLLERINAGEKAEDIAEEIYNPVLQWLGLTAFDPL